MSFVAEDLSQVHHPISDLFSWMSTQNDSAEFRLKGEQVAFFHEHGYVSGIRVLSDRQLEVLRHELEALAHPDHPGSEFWYEYNSNESTDPTKVLFHALGAWRIKPAFHDILWNTACLVPASQLLDGAVRFWHDQLFCKPAHHGGVVAWHQDYSYWTRTRPMAHLTCWIGLDDSTRDNGCLHYVPGSHRWDLLPITGLAGDMTAIRQVLSDEQWEAFQHPRPVELRAGECSFHHPLMVHGSYENRTDRQRRAVVLNYCRDGVCSASDEPLLAGTDIIPSGQPLGGQFYPLLFAPTAHALF
ncbi:MAG: phytanoyl-CoA dioxygenase family protein [Planctomycetaceae bacterium]|nr:phytanoyl-CoA dioxygenase family protein [Planctomycetaceae bacterium]